MKTLNNTLLTLFVLILLSDLTNSNSIQNKSLSLNSNKSTNKAESKAKTSSTSTNISTSTNTNNNQLNVFFKLNNLEKNNEKDRRFNRSKNTTELKKLTNSNKNIKNNRMSVSEEDSGTPLIQIPTNKNQILNKHENLTIIMSDWFKISSPQFKNPNLYPVIINNDYSKRAIKLDTNNFRQNEYFQKITYNNKDYPPSKYHFWFRYSDKNLYYSTTPSEFEILGSISIKSIIRASLNSDDDDFSECITLSLKDDSNSSQNNEDSKWNICTEDLQTRHKWFCRIQKDLGVSSEDCNQLILDNVEPTIIEKKITQPIIMIPMPSKDCNDKWSYKNNGSDWECECEEGKEQSPINIPNLNSSDVVRSPVKPVFFYEETSNIINKDSFEGLYVKNDKAKIIYTNGYISIKHPSFGQVVTLDGVVYSAQEIRFHTPSEHTINGKKFDMEIEVIHYGQSQGAINKQLILNLLVEKYPGEYNMFLEDIDAFNLPNPLTPVKEINHDMHINKLFFTTQDKGYLNLKDFDFFTYQGSLSAPPCNENTIHIVVKEPIRIGSTVVTLFKEALKVPDVVDSTGNVVVNSNNISSNRNVQPLNGRRIYFYKGHSEEANQINTDEEDNDLKSNNGHYEKVPSKHVSYYHVSSDKPSGLPGSFVVSESEAKGI